MRTMGSPAAGATRRRPGIALIKTAIWLVTAFFVVMMFYPLVMQMITRLTLTAEPDFPY
jgi:hypothetical protein